MKDCVSFIVPVYNVEAYLSRCLDSILGQTYQNIEIILVDDGSKDNSGNICDDYSAKDARIKVFHIPNGGVGNARNFALTKVSGDWFTFVDSDDWIEPDYAEILLCNAKENDCAVSGCGYVYNREYSIGIDNSNSDILVLNSSDDCIRNFISPGLSLNGMSTLKLYKYDIFKEIKFDNELKVNEDCLYSYNLFKKCNRACVSSAKLYHWFLRDDSACHSKPSKFDLSAANVFIYLLEETEYLCDEVVSKQLKKNYVLAASNILFYVKYKAQNKEAREAKTRIKKYYKQISYMLNRKQRVKSILVIRFSWLINISRHFNGK